MNSNNASKINGNTSIACSICIVVIVIIIIAIIYRKQISDFFNPNKANYPTYGASEFVANNPVEFAEFIKSVE